MSTIDGPSAGLEILNRKRRPGPASTRKFWSRSPARAVRDASIPKPSRRTCLAASTSKAGGVVSRGSRRCTIGPKAILRPRKRPWRASAQAFPGQGSRPAWQASPDRNLTTAFWSPRRPCPMTSRDWRRIIMVASVTGPVMAIRADAAYARARAGMVGLTRAAAIDAARHGITVNAVAPGWIATGSQTPGERDEGLATPIGRSATPEDSPRRSDR
ncbi:MAG TPA: hypothetical protein DHU96_08060 [Actinobacteria bacterium]|nr:hypothetical protein [Actinomycetota bacterium]